MAFAGHALCKLSIGLQCQVLLLPGGKFCANWLMHTSSLPMKGPEDEVSTSLSVRHHPKETLKAEELRTSTTIKGHEDGVMNSSLDQKALSFVLGNKLRIFLAALLHSESKVMSSGLNLKALRFNFSKGRKNIQRSIEKAFTAVERRKKLQAKRFPIHVINAVIIDFQSRGLINDCLYAETFSRLRWSSSSWGPWRIKQNRII
ncbi:hypothetical protein NMG60_11002043 [Bertholletia excelsa]